MSPTPFSFQSLLTGATIELTVTKIQFGFLLNTPEKEVQVTVMPMQSGYASGRVCLAAVLYFAPGPSHGDPALLTTFECFVRTDANHEFGWMLKEWADWVVERFSTSVGQHDPTIPEHLAKAVSTHLAATTKEAFDV